jgi:hypothetical protein
MGILGVGVVVLVGLAVAMGPRAANAEDRASVDAGRTAGRGLLILRDPKVCAIALLRERCKADVDAFLEGRTDADFKEVPNIGAHPASGLRAFVTDGDRSKFDNALGWLNSRQSTAAMWTADARGAALFDAGIEDVMLPAGQGVEVMELLGAGSVMDLVAHAAQIPSNTLPVAVPDKPAGVRSTGPGAVAISGGTMKFARDLVSALDATMPPAALVTMRFVDGPAGDAALGVASSTIAELIDSPAWLFQADAQRFIDDYAARLASIAPARAAEIAGFRSALRVKPNFSHDGALRQYNRIVASVGTSDQSRARPFVMGAFAAQLVYNAAILRDQNLGAMMSRFVSAPSPLDASVPGWSAARASANVSTDADWGTQYQLGLRLVDLIEKANR